MAATSKSPVPRPAEVEWYYVREGVEIGPVTESDLLSAAREHSIGPDSLVWQKAFDRWKQAANVPMIAVNMGYPIASIRIDQVASTRRTEPAQAPPLEAMADDSGGPQDLDDAVTDDEAAEPIIDFDQAREILGRASLPSPDRSIPPASYASIPVPDETQGGTQAGKLLLAAMAVGTLILGAGAVVLTAREPQRRPSPLVPAVNVLSNETHPSTFVGEKALATARTQVSSDLPPSTLPVTITKGSLDVGLVMNQLRHGLPMFDEQCWDKLRAPVGEIAENPSISIEISVDRLGNVYELQSTDPPPGYRGVGRCIIGRMRGWKFPRAEQGSHAVITIARVRD